MSMPRPKNDRLELIRRINRARIAGEDPSILERELYALTHPPKVRAPRKTKPQITVEKNPHRVALLEQIIKETLEKCRSLGWAWCEFQRRDGAQCPRAIWKHVVTPDVRDRVIDRYVDRRSWSVEI